MKTVVLVLGLMLCPLLAICLGQQAIVQPYYNWTFNINLVAPIGQSFTALDAHISTIGFNLQNLDPSPASITYDLYAGEGISGTVLGSSTFELLAGPAAYHDRDFSSITLIPGQIYTVIISTPTNNSQINLEQWAYLNGRPVAGMADYPGGHAIFAGEPSAYFDLAFRIEPAVKDSDGDGVPDDIDECPDTPAGAIVNAHGCSIDQLVPCGGPRSGGTWKNHGQYVSGVAETAYAFVVAGLMNEEQAAAVVKAAAQSSCGEK